VRLVLTLALRNLFRHKRRTLLTTAALGLGIALMVLGRAWTGAMQRAVVEPAKNGTLGHVQVFAQDAAADEGGSVSFIMPQNNYRLISLRPDRGGDASTPNQSGSRGHGGALLSFETPPWTAF
jgi:hypothetical protein